MIKAILCISIFMIAFPVYAAELGRLFVSESERSKIDFMRKNELYEDRIKKSENSSDKEKSVGTPVKNAPGKKVEPENSVVTINGFILRENGDATVWVNGAVNNENLLKEIEIQKQPDRKNQIVLKSKKEMKRLKVGQKWDYKADEVYDFY